MGETLENRTMDSPSRRDFLRAGVTGATAYAVGLPVAEALTPSAPGPNLAYLASLLQEKEKLPVPSAADIKTREADLRELYKDDYAKIAQRGVDDGVKAEVASKFLNTATAEGTGRIERFILLRDARDISAEAKAFDITYDSLIKMDETYEINLEDTVKDAVGKIPKRGLTKEDIINNASLNMRLAEYAINHSDVYSPDNYSAGADFAKTASRLFSRVDRNMKKQADSLVKVIPELDKEHKAFFDASLKMSVGGNDVDDPKTNEAIGRYLCFRKENWDEGIKFLKKSDNSVLKMLTSMELNLEDTAEDKYELAKRWYEASKSSRVKRGSLEQENFQGRARYWCQNALATASGTTKTKIERMLKDIPSTTSIAGGIAGGIGLLAMIDPQKDTFSGEWQRSGQSISTPRSTSCLKIPYDLPKEYDITMTIKPKDGIDSVIFGLVKDNVNFVAWIDNSFQADKYSGFQMVGNNPMTSTANKTVHRGKVLKSNSPNTIVYSVRNNTMSIKVNGNIISQWEKSHGQIGNNRILAPDSYSGPYIAVFDTALEIINMTLTPISGGIGKRQTR